MPISSETAPRRGFGRAPVLQSASRLLRLKISRLFPLAAVLALTGCSTSSFVLFHPEGPVGRVEWIYTLIDTGVMLLIILPCAVMAAFFFWRYRKGGSGRYDPSWSHSLPLELTMWGIPIIIVAFLGWASYHSTMLVNPFGPAAIKMNKPGDPPLVVDVISTDWQWVFIYPQYGIATIDDLPVPAGRPVKLNLTSTSVTNDFFIPAVAPMIDVMPGMRTMDGFQVNHTGTYEGYSANFSGEGFSWMQFATRIMKPDAFDAWVKQTQQAPAQLSYAVFQRVAQPTVNVGAKPYYFSHVDPNLFRQVYDDARNGVVYMVPENLKIIKSHVNYTLGNNSRQ